MCITHNCVNIIIMHTVHGLATSNQTQEINEGGTGNSITVIVLAVLLGLTVLTLIIGFVIHMKKRLVSIYT